MKPYNYSDWEDDEEDDDYDDPGDIPPTDNREPQPPYPILYSINPVAQTRNCGTKSTYGFTKIGISPYLLVSSIRETGEWLCCSHSHSKSFGGNPGDNPCVLPFWAPPLVGERPYSSLSAPFGVN